MKKILLFAMGAMMSVASFAQDEVDVTDYIVNAGLDEDLTFQADGATKEIVNKDHSFSDRSQAWVAADSSVYAWGKGTRKDGKSPAWNGFYGQIKGWKQGDKSYTGKLYYPFGSDAAEWVYFGTVPYAIGAEAVPIADDGTTFLAAPSKPEKYNTDDNIGFMYLRAGWGGSATYKQVVNLPCAQYRLEYWTINANASASNGKNMTRVVCRKDVFTEGTPEEAKASMLKTEWTKHEIEFTPTAEFTVEFGFKAEGGSGSNPFLCIDGIKLYKVGEANPITILQSDLSAIADEATALGYPGLAAQASDYSFEVEEIDPEDEAALKEAEAQIQVFNNALQAIPAVDAILAKMENILASTDYPGKADFKAVYDKIAAYKAGGDPTFDYATAILGAVEEAEAAIKTCYRSEEASPEAPGDYTFLVQSPWFIQAAYEPTFTDGAWVFPNAENYTDGSTHSDFSSEGWKVTGSYTGGDQRLNYKFGYPCWNAWGSGISGTIAVGQTLTDLPNGYYTVSAELVTQTGCLTDQHVYAESTAEKKISSPLTSEGWDLSTWEKVAMTADQKVLVVDGQLTIGAEGTGTGEGSAGWFCVSHFELQYLGEADPQALKNAYDAKLAAAMQLLETMHFAADKLALGDSIEKYGNTTDYIAALAALTPAMKAAETSEAKYQEYMMEGKTLPTIKQNLETEDGAIYKNAKDIVVFAYNFSMDWINGADATYTKIDSIVNYTKSYVNNYVPVYNNADSIAGVSSDLVKDVITPMLAEQKTSLLSTMQADSVVNKYIADLNGILGVVDKQNIFENTEATDYTKFIKNPKLESEDGWQFERGNGDKNTTSGQWYDGSSTKYIDSYHSETIITPREDDPTQNDTTYVGLQNFKGWQEITDLPNGTYTLGVYTRTPAEGAYIFAAIADTSFVEIPLHYSIDPTTGEEVLASDKFGPMWEEAYTKIVEEGMPTEDPMFEYYNAIYNANSTQGRGWRHQEIAELTVTDHKLTIGTQCGTELSATEKVFAGNWYSVGGWTLTLTAMGNNDGWSGPLQQYIATGVESMKTVSAELEGIYTLSGAKVNKLQRGLNIVVRNGKAIKVLVK